MNVRDPKPCAICGRFYKTALGLERHIAIKHGEIVESVEDEEIDEASAAARKVVKKMVEENSGVAVLTAVDAERRRVESEKKLDEILKSLEGVGEKIAAVEDQVGGICSTVECRLAELEAKFRAGREERDEEVQAEFTKTCEGLACKLNQAQEETRGFVGEKIEEALKETARRAATKEKKPSHLTAAGVRAPLEEATTCPTCSPQLQDALRFDNYRVIRKVLPELQDRDLSPEEDKKTVATAKKTAATAKKTAAEYSDLRGV